MKRPLRESDIEKYLVKRAKELGGEAQAMEVPTSKPDLLEFLKTYCTGVNYETGEYVGLIGVNEMIAFKLPESLYQRFMKEAHYDAPLREEDKLEETAQLMRDQAARSDSKLIEGDGMEDMYRYAPAQGAFS